MMPLEIERTPLARRDLFDIWDYISPNSIQGATRVIGEIYDAFSMLAEQPASGRARLELGPELRGFPVTGYLVVYRYSETTLTIVRVLHSARDITQQSLSE